LKVLFALGFLLLGFIGGYWVSTSFMVDMIRDCAKKGELFLDTFRIAFADKEKQE